MEIHAFDLEDLNEQLGDIKTLDKLDNVSVLGTSNFGGIVILINKTGESVFAQDIWDSGYHNIEECEIKYDIPEDFDTDDMIPCFEYDGNKYFLNEFLPKNY